MNTNTQANMYTNGRLAGLANRDPRMRDLPPAVRLHCAGDMDAKGYLILVDLTSKENVEKRWGHHAWSRD